MMIKIALVDDHILLRKGLGNMLKESGHDVLFEADNGKDCMEKMKAGTIPSIVLMDINMPAMDGYETTAWLKKNHPSIKVLALSMYDDETSIIRMLKSGAKGYILKDSSPHDLTNAIETLHNKGSYYSEIVTGKIVNAVSKMGETDSELNSAASLHDKEIEFIKFCSTDLTYKEIADKMNLSPRTIDGYRDELFRKLNIKSRVGIVMFAIRHNIIHV